VEQEALLLPGFVFNIGFQPLPYSISAASVANGGNVLGLDPANGDRMWMEYTISWLTALGDGIAQGIAKQQTSDIETYSKTKYAGVKNSHYQAGDLAVKEYNPIFYNDAMFDQKPLQSLGNSTYERLQNYQKAVDPSGFFSTRTGGFKYT
jgi:hypothetical protein